MRPALRAVPPPRVEAFLALYRRREQGGALLSDDLI
jgi:hypothetical protein